MALFLPAVRASTAFLAYWFMQAADLKGRSILYSRVHEFQRPRRRLAQPSALALGQVAIDRRAPSRRSRGGYSQARAPWHAACGDRAARRAVPRPRSCGCWATAGEPRSHRPHRTSRRVPDSGQTRSPCIAGSASLARECRVQPDITSALASRTTRPPRQSATPTQRGRPRLPVPAVRRQNLISTPRPASPPRSRLR